MYTVKFNECLIIIFYINAYANVNTAFDLTLSQQYKNLIKTTLHKKFQKPRPGCVNF